MARKCECGSPLNDDDECARCRADWARMCAEYGQGNVRAAMEPPGPWKSRDDLIREWGE
jgi:hypothetical protein